MQSRLPKLLAPAALCLLLLPPAGDLAAQARLTYREGTVHIERGSRSVDPEIGATLQRGDTVVTGGDGLAIIALSPQTTIKTRANTRVRIDTLGVDAKVDLRSGGLFSRIVGHLVGSYSVVTPTASAGVRGTEFFIAYGRTVGARPDVWLCVNSGTVAVSVLPSGQSVDVPAGKGINIIAGTRLTTPRPYRWTQKLNWNMDPQTAPVQDHTNLDQAYADLLNQDYD